MSVVVAVETLGPCRREVRVEVPAPAVDAEFARVVAEYQRQARLPGFRRGKVPLAVVRQRFREDIDREVAERLVPRYWQQAEAESRLDTMASPSVRDLVMEPGRAMTFTATVEVRPEFELRNLRDWNLPEVATVVPPEEVDRAIDELRRQVAEWTPVERAAGRGDLVAARVRETTLGAPEGEDADPVAFEVGDPNIWEELSLAASGLAAGQSAAFERRPEGSPAGAEGLVDPGTRRFRVEVTEVRERQLPPLDAEFARKVGNFDDLGALRSDVEARLAAGKRLERRRQREQAVLDQLRERHPIPLPEGVVEHERHHLVEEYAEGLARRGVDLEKAGIDWNQLAEQVRPQAERRVHIRILLDAVAERESLVVSEQEFEEALATLARAQGSTAGALRQGLAKEGRLGSLRAQMRREKALNRLVGEEEAG